MDKVFIQDVKKDFSILEKYDCVEIVDKNTKELKGIYLSQKLAEKLKDIIDQKVVELYS